MGRIIVLLAISILTGGLASSPGQPVLHGQTVFTLDQQESALTFEVSKLGFMKEQGRFAEVSATITASGSDMDQVRMNSVIDVASLQLSSEETRKRLLGEDWFNAADYPQAEFDCADVRITGAMSAEASGTLTIRGISQPATFDIQFNENITDTLAGGEALDFTAEGSFSRSAFGMTRMSGLVGDTVDLDFVGRFERTSGHEGSPPEELATEFPE